jgi:uncharacterized protein
MLTLRGHHLICLVAFSGQGYSAAFARNFKKLQGVYLSKSRHRVKVITAADQACQKCPHLVGNQCVSPTDGPNKKIVALDKKALKLLGIKPGIYKTGNIHSRLRQLKKGSIEAFCKKCSWYSLTHCPAVIARWAKASYSL